MTRSRLLTRIAVTGVIGVCATSAPPGGQAAPAQTPPTAAISGVVVDGLTKAPIADAVVSLGRSDSTPTGLQQPRQLTDAKGRFAFVNLPASSNYALTASKFGYLQGGFSRDVFAGTNANVIVVGTGEWIADARVTLWRPGAIGGTITDERGEPVAGVFVRVLPSLTIQGRQELAAGALTTTDDRGAYRIGDLPPGRYIIQVPSVQSSYPAPAADPAPDASRLRAPGAPAPAPSPSLELFNMRLALNRYPTPPPPVDGRTFAYPMMFYPSTPLVAQAETVELKFGDDRTAVNIRLEPVPSARVSGIVEGPPESLVSLTLRLLPAGLESLGLGAETATALVGADGRFTFLNVPAGTYTIDAPRQLGELIAGTPFGGMSMFLGGSPGGLPMFPGREGRGMNIQSIEGAPPGTAFQTTTWRGSAGNYWGRATVTVGSRDETNVVVRMRTAGSMRGRVVAERDPNRPAPTSGPASLVQLEAANGSPSLGLVRRGAGPGSDVEMAFDGLLAGEYVLRINTAVGWLVKSVMWQGRDYLDLPFDAAATQDFSGVIVTATNAVPTLTGAVRAGQGASAADATVIAFPANHDLWKGYGFSPSRIKATSTASDGTYRFTTLPAGDYLVIAVGGPAHTAWQDPQFLEMAERAATRTTLTWGEKQTVDLQVSEVRR